MAHIVFIRGIPQQPTVNVRDQPATSGALVFKAQVGAQATCSLVKPDAGGGNFQGQVYRWLFLKFADGQTGWVRDDLLDLQGDCTAFGYGNFNAKVFAFTAAFTAPVTGTVPVTATTPGTGASPVATGTMPVVEGTAPSTGTNSATVSTPAVTTPTTPVKPSSPSAQCDAAVRRDIQARVRALPSVSSAQITMLNPSTPVRVLSVVAGQDGQPFRWVSVLVDGVPGYIREDLLTYSPNCAGLGLPVGDTSAQTVIGGAPSTSLDRFGTPVNGSYVVTQEFGVNRHKGIDLGGAVGLPILARGIGIVAYIVKCTRCRDSAPNFRSQGVADWDPISINDAAWGYGFGNHVVVRHAWADMPLAMRTALTGQGLVGAYAYVIHAHLSRIDVIGGATVGNGTPLGLLGNTGNTTGAHLHLEIRISLDANERTIFNRVVVDPRNLYQF